jgi:ergothioneine biosynthesis protein EgtB
MFEDSLMVAVGAAIRSDLHSHPSLAARFAQVRTLTNALCTPLQPEDFVVQSMPDASPVKWHLAHTSWFFERFVLRTFVPAYRVFDPQYDYLFNSYYQSLGTMHARAERGLLTRPTTAQVMQYRAHVDAAMSALLVAHKEDEQIAAVTALGLNHEQQHQELLLTDLKHLFSRNPLHPAYRRSRATQARRACVPLRFVSFAGGIVAIGANDAEFSFDNERLRHRVLLAPFALANRPVTNAEFTEFIRDRGYARPELWLSDGWSLVQQERWQHPLYWSDGLESEFTLAGEAALEGAAPACHLSYYEADAYARWAGARLPTEAEWEHAASTVPLSGHFLESGELHPLAGDASSPDTLQQIFGDVWEWTSSAYAPYPGYRPAAGALGEYNGKFMCNQFVLRGGSCATPSDHIRTSYRNFFYPHARWQFTGLRLARDA